MRQDFFLYVTQYCRTHINVALSRHKDNHAVEFDAMPCAKLTCSIVLRTSLRFIHVVPKIANVSRSSRQQRGRNAKDRVLTSIAAIRIPYPSHTHPILLPYSSHICLIFIRYSAVSKLS
jgi:hypothetical protein